MDPAVKHPYEPDAGFDGGDLDCGGGLLLLIRRNIDPLERGQLLEILSTEPTVEIELPAWCRMTRNEMVSWTKAGDQRSFMISKGPFVPNERADCANPASPIGEQLRVEVKIPDSLPGPAAAPAIAPMSVMGIGSWPRPGMDAAGGARPLENRLDDEEFHATADDAVRLNVDAQLRAGVDVLTDGEQRRDSYASFVGGLLDNCQLIPLSDLAAIVDDPEKFEMELRGWMSLPQT